MERRKSQQSNQSNSICSRCGCSLEAGRVVRKTTRYCRACAPVARRERSAAWKQAFRAMFGWRKYHDDYSPFVDDEHKREHRRKYMRDYRERKRREGGSSDLPGASVRQAA